MKAIKSVFFAAALAAAGFAGMMDARAASGHAGGESHSSGGGHWSGGAHGSGSGHGAAGGHWSGGGRWSGAGHWSGGHGHYYGGRYWGPGWGFYLGAPLFLGSYYWGSSYWGYPYDYYYPRTVVVDPVIEGSPPSYPEGEVESAPTTEVAPNAPGAPAQGPTYMNFCASANAYYPKVTSCPEGWKFLPSR